MQPFATVARDLHALTGGSGPDWEKAAALGRSIDPANALYGGGVQTASSPDLSATVIMQAAAVGAVAAAESNEAAVMIETPPVEEIPAAAPVDETSASLDFDLDLGNESEAAAVPEVEAPPAADEVLSLDFDLDLGAEPAEETPAAPVVEAAAEPESGGLDFDLGSLAAEPEPSQAEAPVELPASGGDEVAALDFDFDIGLPEAAEAPPAPAAPVLDLSAISLDLDEPAAQAEPEIPALEFPAMAEDIPDVAPPAAPVEVVVEDDPEVATKLELAQAYEEMGDKEGARELLNEVLNEGSPAQRENARAKLAQLA